MKPVVLIAPYFPPRRRVGALRPYRFAKYLPEFGYKPVIVHIEDSGNQLTDREKEALKDCDFIPVKPPFDLTTRNGKSTPDRVKPSRAASDPPFIDKMVPMDTWWPLLYYKLPRLLDEISLFRPELVWSTADPWSSNWLGMKVKLGLDLPWAADFRDPWTLCSIRGRQKPAFTRRLERRLEKRIMATADHVTFTADRTTQLYKDHYQTIHTPASTIYNSYDEAAFTPETNVHLDCPPDALNVFFFGAFRQLSPAAPVIKVLSELQKTDPEVSAKIRIISNAPLRDEDQTLAERFGVAGQFITAPRVLPEESRAYLRQADVLLLSTSELRDEIIPAKLWDYIAADRPMIGLTSNPEVHDLMQGQGGRAFYPKETEAAANALRDMIGEKLEKGYCTSKAGKKASDVMHPFTSRETTQQLAGIFDTLIKQNKPAAGI